MNNNRHFDEHIKNQFNNYSPDVHPRIWENIIAEKDKKRPAGFWISMFSNRNKMLLIGLMIALSTGGAWVYYAAANQKHMPAANDQPGTHNNKDFRKTDQPEAQQVNAAYLNGDATIESADNSTETNNPLAPDGGIKATISPASLETDDVEQIMSETGYKSKKYYTGLGGVLVNTTSAGLTVDDEDEYEGQGTLLGRLTFNAEKYLVKRKTRNQESVSFKQVVFLPDCPTIEKDAAGNKRYFEFYAGPDYALRSLQDTANSAYLQKRKESTKFRSAFSAGIRYTKVFNNSMSVRAGINYSQINEKFTYNQGNVVQVTYIININGDTIGSYTTTGSRYKSTINRYRSIDIPLVAGYEIGNGKLHANINAGAVVNIYSWQKGDVLDTAGNPVSITTGKSSSPYQFKTNAGVGFIGAVSVYYKLNDRLHLMAEPYFRYNFSPMNKENITLKQKYQTAGLRLGVRLDLH